VIVAIEISANHKDSLLSDKISEQLNQETFLNDQHLYRDALIDAILLSRYEYIVAGVAGPSNLALIALFLNLEAEVIVPKHLKGVA
jgi:hypothetical protein